MGKVAAIALMALLVVGCATTKQTGSLCTVGPFRPDQGVTERWTDSEMDQLIVLNESGERLCGWKP